MGFHSENVINSIDSVGFVLQPYARYISMDQQLNV